MKSGGVVRSTCKEERRSLCFSLFLPFPPVLSKLERETRYWPMVYADTLTFTLAQVLSITGLKGQRSYDSQQYHLCTFQDLDPLPHVIKQDVMTDSELEECKKVFEE